MKFKAAILNQLKKDLIVDEIKIINRLKKGQVLVKVNYSGVCGSQIGEINGIKGKDRFLPHLLGHEGVGEILEVSKEIKRFTPGQKVILHWKPSQGIQSDTPQYLWNKKIVNAGWVTTFNELAIVSENRISKIDDNSSFLDNVLFGCAILTGFGVIKKDAKIKEGDTVLVFGAGGIGLNIIQAAKYYKAKKIIAIDIFKNRLKLAKTTGAHECFLFNTSKYNNLIEKLNKSKSVDVFIDNTGNSKIIELGYQIIKFDGKLVLVGVPKHDDFIKINTLPIHFGKKLIGSHGGAAVPHKDIKIYKKIIKKNKLMNKRLISKIYNLDDINKAIKDMTNGKIAGRAVIKNV